jgi:hypothetical protein
MSDNTELDLRDANWSLDEKLQREIIKSAIQENYPVENVEEEMISLGFLLSDLLDEQRVKDLMSALSDKYDHEKNS